VVNKEDEKSNNKINFTGNTVHCPLIINWAPCHEAYWGSGGMGG